MSICEEKPTIEGTIEAFTHTNMKGFGKFETFGFVRVSMDAWKQVWDKNLKRYVYTQTGFETWQKYINTTSAELKVLRTELAQAGITAMTFNPTPSKPPGAGKFVIRR